MANEFLNKTGLSYLWGRITAIFATKQEVAAISVPTKVSDLTNDSNYQTGQQVSAAITAALTSAYRYKGSVATVNDLPASGNTAGDVYDVQATGVNYAWTGSAWDALGSIVDISTLWGKSELTAITTGEIDVITG
jgi:hypothetical protein